MNPSILLKTGLSFLLFQILPLSINPCGYTPPTFGGYSLLHPFLLEEPLEKPALLGRHLIDFELMSEAASKGIGDENIVEWQGYFDGVPTKKDIRFIIYESSIEEMMSVGQKILDANRSINDRLASNDLVKYILKTKDVAFVNYLIYAKRCEPLASKSDGRYAIVDDEWQWVPRDEGLAEELLEMGRKCYQEVKSKFLKMRYAFQVVRLEHYFSGDPVAAYEKYIAPLENIGSIMQYWAMGHVGGHLVVAEDIADKIEGNYLLSKVVSHTKSRARTNWQSINIQSDQEWEMLKERCENVEERANLYYLRALDEKSIALEEMRQIYKFHPSFEKLDVLLIRELQKLETTLLKERFPNKRYLETPALAITTSAALAYSEELRLFVQEVAQAKKTERSLLWRFSEAYLYFLSEDYSKAKINLAGLTQDLQAGSLLKDQVELLQFVVELSLRKTIDANIEKWLGEIVQHNTAFRSKLKYGSTPYSFNASTGRWEGIAEWDYEYDNFDFITEFLSYKYNEQRDIGKSYLCRYSIYGLMYFPNSEISRDILALMEKPNKNAWEALLIQKESIQTSEEVLDILGTSLIGEEKYAEALDVFQELPSQEKLFYNPFKSQRSDIKLSIDSTAKNWMNKEMILRKRIALGNAVQLQQADLASHYLELGNYYYNSSYWGYAWQVRDYFISISSMWYYKEPQPFTSYGEFYGYPSGIVANIEFINLDKAKTYFELAMEEGTDEQAAEACFSLAKIAFNEKYVKPIDNKSTGLRDEYYDKMRTQYNHTTYYQQSIQECKFFDYYLSKNK